MDLQAPLSPYPILPFSTVSTDSDDTWDLEKNYDFFRGLGYR